MMEFLVIAWRGNGLMAGSVYSCFSLKFTSVLDFLFVYYGCYAYDVSFSFILHRSACFSYKNNGNLAWQCSQIFYYLLKIKLFCYECGLSEVSLEVFLGEMIMGLSGVHSLR